MPANQKAGRRYFKDFLAWAPFTAEEKKELEQWPKNSVFSLFEIQLKKKQVYFSDRFTGKEYLSALPYEFISRVAEDLLKGQPILFFGVLPPKKTNENFYDIQQTLDFNLRPEMVANLVETYQKSGLADTLVSLFLMYKLELEGVQLQTPQYEIEEDFSYLDDMEDFETSFIPLVKMPRETNPTFAKRLLSMDPELAAFPYAKSMQKLLSKTLQTFPKLVVPRTNAVPLIEAIKLLFTDATRDPEEDYYESDDVSHFWTVLIETHLPEDLKSLTAEKVKPEYWQNNDEFSGSFFDEDDYL